MTYFPLAGYGLSFGTPVLHVPLYGLEKLCQVFEALLLFEAMQVFEALQVLPFKCHVPRIPLSKARTRCFRPLA